MMDDFQVEPQRVIDTLARENAELARKYAYVSAAFDQVVAELQERDANRAPPSTTRETNGSLTEVA